MILAAQLTRFPRVASIVSRPCKNSPRQKPTDHREYFKRVARTRTKRYALVSRTTTSSASRHDVDALSKVEKTLGHVFEGIVRENRSGRAGQKTNRKERKKKKNKRNRDQRTKSKLVVSEGGDGVCRRSRGNGRWKWIRRWRWRRWRKTPGEFTRTRDSDWSATRPYYERLQSALYS